MKPFDQLTHRGQVRRLRRLARAVLAAYPVQPQRIQPLVHLENTTYRIDTVDGRYILRINRPYHRSLAEIRSEMLWLAAIRRDTGLVVPEPVINHAGELVTTTIVDGVPEPRHCVLFRWVHGRFRRRSAAPIHLELVGRLTARLHRHAEQFAPPPGFYRNSVEWGQPDAPGEMAKLAAAGLVAGDDLLPPADRETFVTAEDRLRTAVAAIGDGPDRYGLLHADLHLANCLFHRGEARVIDFDDCGWGHFVNDAAITLWYLRWRPDYDVLQAAYWRGYRAERPFPATDEAQVDIFQAARTMLMAMWFAGRADNPTLRQRAPALVAACVADLREFLAGRPQRGPWHWLKKG